MTRTRNHWNDWRRQQGCTVTWRDPDGGDHVVSETGHVEVALKRIVNAIPAGSQVRCISTWKTILKDLSRPTAGPRRMVDPWAYERWILSKIGRPELCPPLPRQLDLIPEEHRALEGPFG